MAQCATSQSCLLFSRVKCLNALVLAFLLACNRPSSSRTDSAILIRRALCPPQNRLSSLALAMSGPGIPVLDKLVMLLVDGTEG